VVEGKASFVEEVIDGLPTGVGGVGAGTGTG
jgi:hypothetical protein